MGVKDLEDLKKLSMLRSQIDGISIDEVTSTEFPTVSSDDRISDALAVMKQRNYQDLPVVDGGEFVGMVSYASILRKKSVTLDAKVKNLVRNTSTVSKGDEITKIAEMMVSTNCRQLPVVNGKKIVGIIERNKLVEIVRGIKALHEIKVWEIMTNPVESVKVNDLMDDALEIMIREDYRTIPVINDANNVVGIVGMREIIDNNWKKDNKTIGDLEKSARSQITVESIATMAPKTIDWDSDIFEAVDIMVENHFSTLPVLEGKELVGIMTEYDVLELISACRERDMLFVQISGLEDDEKHMTDAIYADIESMVTKVSKMYKPESLTMHVSRYNDVGGNFKYSISARLFINGTAILGKEVGWDLTKTASDLITKLEDAVINMKDSKVTFRKRKK
ncbi:MAG: CBS domain-containing protein [Candidatus Methanomethylophilaceae archaeon]|nr:CBS domain-containing protein [Candidatus Methanomethylophilaceae archaeon]MBR2348453.1 CBS domain-containing protein [Candidatus Methanomethylophilaceae archaeon]MBR2394962.1 CBS domain-containing protein [Candidatus Methanomethylophilaceae archaeon]